MGQIARGTGSRWEKAKAQEQARGRVARGRDLASRPPTAAFPTTVVGETSFIKS